MFLQPHGKNLFGFRKCLSFNFLVHKLQKLMGYGGACGGVVVSPLPSTAWFTNYKYSGRSYKCHSSGTPLTTIVGLID